MATESNIQTQIDEILRSKQIDINIIKEAFEQCIIDTYSSIRIRHRLPGGDTVYSTDKNIRKKCVQYDPKYYIRMMLITQNIYRILHESIISGNIDDFSNPYSYRNRQRYIKANIDSNFQLTDTLFSDQELEYLTSVEPIF